MSAFTAGAQPPSASIATTTITTASIPTPTPPPDPSWQTSNVKRALSDVGGDSPRKIDDGSEGVDGDAAGRAGPAKKRSKLTEAEREARERERAEREREKAIKEKERLAKKAERDEKKRIKDEEKKKREGEKARKEKAQMRLGAFFGKPAAGPAPPSTAVSSTQMVIGSPPPDASPKKQEGTDYERCFQPFFVKPNVAVAPLPFERDDDYKLVIKNTLDRALELLKGQDFMGGVEYYFEQCLEAGVGERLTGQRIVELMHIPVHMRGRRGKLPGYSTKDILARISAPEDSSLPPIIDLNGVDQHDLSRAYLNLLNSLPAKFLRFAEDVRPPYSGTYTRKPTSSGLSRGRNPFQRSLPRVNYDYDSEAEWEEEELDGDGEELLSDDDEDDDAESVDEDLEEFLDDEDEEGAGKNRSGVVGALVPVCSDLCWEDVKGKNPRREFEGMRISILVEGVPAPIDPFSTTYWNPSARQQAQQQQQAPRLANSIVQFFPTTTSTKSQAGMPPPGASISATTAQPTSESSTKKSKPVHLVPADELDAFKQAIEGSDLTKAGIVEFLKKQFPHLHKEAIKNSVNQVAQRIGKNEKEKKWVLNPS